MKTTLPCLLFLVALSLPMAPSVQAADNDKAVLADLARSHEQVFKTLSGDHVAVVLQKGEKQFTVYGVTKVRAVGPVLEITVKNGEKYSVSASDVFFITNNGFKI